MTSRLRRSVVAVLIIALTLAGLGRAMASAPHLGVIHDVIPGVHVPICHSGEGPVDPSQPTSHDCCDECALSAPVVMPAPPIVAEPAPIEHYAEHAQAIAWAPVIARLRDPRLSRGPPVA